MARDDVIQKATNGNGAGAGDAVRSALEHKEFFVPAVVGLAGAVAAVKGPSVVRGLSSAVEGKVQSTAQGLGSKATEGAKANIGEQLAGGGLAGKAVGKLTGLSDGKGGDGGSGSGGKKTRRLPIQRWTDVAVPVDKAYDAWTKFDQYPKFMHRVLSVEQKGKDKVTWNEKIWFSKRQWEGRITERRENDRIVWTTKSGMSHKGIVSFHELSPNLTRVMVDMEFEPNGIIEKMASGLRFVKRAVQADLARFKTFVEMQDAKGIEYRSTDKQEDGKEQDKDESDEGSGRETQRRSGSSGTRSSSSRTSSSGRKRSTSARRGSSRRTRSSSTGGTRAGSRNS